MKSEIQEAAAIILSVMLNDEAYIKPRLQAAVDAMNVVSAYDHLDVIRAVFHVPAPTPKESGEDDGA